MVAEDCIIMAKSSNAITSNSQGTVPRNGLYLLDDTVAAKNDIPARRSSNIARAPHFYAAPSAGSSDNQSRRTEHRNDRVRTGSGDGSRATLRRAHSSDIVASSTTSGVPISAGKITKKRGVTPNFRGNQPEAAQNRRPAASPETRAAAVPSENKPIAAAASSIAKERAVMYETLNALLQSVLGKNGFVAPADHRGYSAMIAKAMKKIKNPAQLEAFKMKVEEAGKPFRFNFGVCREVGGKKEALNARQTSALDADHAAEYKRAANEFQTQSTTPNQNKRTADVQNQVPVTPAAVQQAAPGDPTSTTPSANPAVDAKPVEGNGIDSTRDQIAPARESLTEPLKTPAESTESITEPSLYVNPAQVG
jgi:hypothetical protein